jgi:hypothetical protein
MYDMISRNGFAVISYKGLPIAVLEDCGHRPSRRAREHLLRNVEFAAPFGEPDLDPEPEENRVVGSTEYRWRQLRTADQILDDLAGSARENR